ncbi:MAG: phenylacetate--CoA ligase family protein [Actinomycetota bacterium]
MSDDMYRHELETLDPEERKGLQVARLRQQVERLRGVESPYWKEKVGNHPGVRSLDDLRSLPFTEKTEFRDSYPYGMLTVPMGEVTRIHASSGTSGKPTIVAYTQDDVRIFAEVVARSLATAGATRHDIIQVAYGYGLFTGGLGLHYGVEEMGATAVPASGGNPGFQVGLMADAGVTGLAATPSFTLTLAEKAEEMGKMSELRLRFGLHGAEPWSEGLREKIEKAWGGGYLALDIYGLSEVIGPGVAMECPEGKGGMHVFEDHFLPEIVDPETGDPVDEGESGELVITTLTKQAQPVLRYRTRDITRFLTDPCPCGRTTRRIARLEGRADDMLIVRGINVYPRAIEEILMSDRSLGPNYAIIVDRRTAQTELRARVELANDGLADEREDIARRLQQQIRQTVRLRAGVEVGMPGSVPRPQTGKAKRVFEQTTEEDPLGG